MSDSVSVEVSDGTGVIVIVGEARGDIGESKSDEVLEAGVTLLFLLGLSGVKNKGCVGGGGHDWGRDK